MEFVFGDDVQLAADAQGSRQLPENDRPV